METLWIPTPLYHLLLVLFTGCRDLPMLQDACIQEKLRVLQEGSSRPAFLNAPAVRQVHETVIHPWTLPLSDPQRCCVRGVLYYGLPGTGKSELAKYVAEHLGFHCIFFGSPQSLIDKYFGETEKRIAALFTETLWFPAIPCIVGFEEFDSISSSRAGNISSSELGWRSALLDQLSKGYPNLVFESSTNDMKSIDGGFLRPGRIDSLIHLGRPLGDDRLAILASNFRVSGYEQVANAITRNHAGQVVDAIASLQPRLQNCTGAEIVKVARQTLRLITFEKRNERNAWSNPSWAEVQDYVERSLSLVIQEAHSPDLHYHSGPLNPSKPYISELKRLFDRFATEMTGRILFNLTLGHIWVEFRDGGGCPVTMQDSVGLRVADILRELNVEFGSKTHFLVDSRRLALFENDPVKSNTPLESFLEETRHSGTSGGSLFVIDFDDLVGVSADMGVQTGMSGAQSRHVQTYTSHSSRLLREQVFANLDSASKRMAFSSPNHQYCLVAAIATHPFVCERIDTSWRTLVSFTLDHQSCPRSIHVINRPRWTFRALWLGQSNLHRDGCDLTYLSRLDVHIF